MADQDIWAAVLGVTVFCVGFELRVSVGGAPAYMLLFALSPRRRGELSSDHVVCVCVRAFDVVVCGTKVAFKLIFDLNLDD